MQRMVGASPRIGFDRFIKSQWVHSALKVRAGVASRDELLSLLDAERIGPAARKKTQTVLNRLWLEPLNDLIEFADRGAAIYLSNPSTPAFPLSWGMAIATYPFFGKVSELVGRLAILQGECTSSEIHRRMSEIYGEREGTYRMTNMVLQTQQDWGAIDRIGREKRVITKKATSISSETLIQWVIEAALRYHRKPLQVSAIESLHVLYPITFSDSVSYIASKSERLILTSDGSGQQLVALHED